MKISRIKKLKHKLINTYDKLIYVLNPRQKWLTSKIPKHWQDKPELLRDIMFAIFVNYIEDECNGKLDPDEFNNDLANGYISLKYVEEHVKRSNELNEIYNYIKFERPKLENDLANSYPDVEIDQFSNIISRSYDEYKKAFEIEKEISISDKWALQTILDYREYLYT
jgi:hypothetical protein